VARAFLSLIPRSWKNCIVTFSLAVQSLQTRINSLGSSTTFSSTGGGVVGFTIEDATSANGRSEAKMKGIKINRTLHPYR